MELLMDIRNIFALWKTELDKLSSEILYKESISDENPTDEEFYFFINWNLAICFYVFYDNWGMGLGLHYKKNKHGDLWYLNDLGILTLNSQLDFMLKIMKDVICNNKIFVINILKNDVDIDFTNYKEVSINKKKSEGLHFSINEMNKL
jgi:hypothetical protein